MRWRDVSSHFTSSSSSSVCADRFVPIAELLRLKSESPESNLVGCREGASWSWRFRGRGGLGAMVLEWVPSLLVAGWAMGLLLLATFPRFLLRPLPSAIGGSKQQERKFLLLVAHPDDECMFFGPTVLSLTELGGCEFHVLCISNGNAEGLGALRKQEMLASCAVLKVPSENVRILDHPALQDGHDKRWNRQLLAQIIRETVESKKIDCVITFDSYGVSGHPNHSALSHSLRLCLLGKAKASQNDPEDSPVEGWELISLNIARKYSGLLEIFLSTLDWLLSFKKIGFHCFVTPNPLTSVAAMKQHKSQWLWYRRLFVVFASYTYVNTLMKIHIEQDFISKNE